MGCCSSTANAPSSPLPVAAESASMPVEPVRVLTATPPVADASSANLSRSRSRTQSLHRATRHSTERSGPTHRTRTRSVPQNAQPMRPVSSQDRRIRAQTLVTPGMGSRSIPGPSNPAHPKTGTRSLTSTMRQVLSNNTKFRILVVGKRGSGKTSLINAVFKVNIPAAPGNPDINHEIHPDDNRYLVVHESPGFGPRDGQNLQAIQDFISNRTTPSCSNAERLHVVWLCVPISDAINGTVGGVEDILKMRQVPVIVAFTKFDQIVEIEGGSSARTRARTQVEQSCRSLFRKEPSDVPAEVVSVESQFIDLIDSLVVTTDRLITGSHTASPYSARLSVQGTKPRTAPVPLVWSAASRAHRDIFIQASIEVGRSRDYFHPLEPESILTVQSPIGYWRGLWSSPNFADQLLKDCVDVIHTDIVEIWNLNDRENYLSGMIFKDKMSHIVEDMAGSLSGAPSNDDPAQWVYDVYRGSQENVRCLMGYIVDLTVILDDLFRTIGANVSASDAELAIDRIVKSHLRDRIHRDICNFVTEASAIRFTVPERDLVLEKIIDLIRQYAVPPVRG